ncbi:hypothetical protein AB0F43_35850 [Kribbella sp. NPDC023972]|uniref:hypothetical protein n=1 Tax=Kribbella sp. NPDC023972 TaxID=3154795 RepID=UPI0033C4C014
MRLRRMFAVTAGALLLLTAGLTEATAAQDAVPQRTTIAAAADADADADDLDAASLTNPTPATVAPPTVYSTLGAPPNFNNCRHWAWYLGETCFQWYGDVQWVKDNIANGWKTAVHVQTNYGKDRFCGALPAADGWGYCDYDHREGMCVRWRLYELKGGETRNFTNWSVWYGTEYGSPC